MMDNGVICLDLVTSDLFNQSLTPNHDLNEAAAASGEVDEVGLEEGLIDELVDDDAVADTTDSDWGPPSRPRAKNTKLPKDRKLRNIIIDLPKISSSTLIHPRSVFQGFVPPAPLVSEADAIQRLMQTNPTVQEGDYVEFQLENFACYISNSNKTIPCEMRSLHKHATMSGKGHFYVNGILRAGNTRFYVQGVVFEEIPLGNYGEEFASVGDQLWICSKLCSKLHKKNERQPKVYYQLKTPSVEYARFHTDFLCVADLAKHVVDFCIHLEDKEIMVGIDHFKSAFATWLKKTHKSDPVFLKWYQQRGSDDFRQSVVANQDFVQKELHVLTNIATSRLFKELGSASNRQNFYERIGARPKNGDETPSTIVTPYIYDCFRHIEGLETLLEPVAPSVSSEEAIKLSWPTNAAERLRFTRTPSRTEDRTAIINGIEVGDLISTPPDTESRWTTESKEKIWYGLVQKVHITKSNKRKFDVTWLYEPEDTPCCLAMYPWTNELFLSDHCTCKETVNVAEDEILGVHSVEWFGTPAAKTEFFVRQTYTTTVEERRFITLEDRHLRCNHDQPPSQKYNIGDTVLVLTPTEDYLQPFELLEYMDRHETVPEVRLRRLRRHREFDSSCAPNALVYTDEVAKLPVTNIATRCIVRFYSPGESIPAPYNRNGAGHAFVITHRLQEGLDPMPIGLSDRPQLRQGFDPTKREAKLRSLDLFCGGGNFGRGVEDGGAVSAKWANDLKTVAIHTYMANVNSPADVHPFLGSVDDLVKFGLQGKFSNQVPRPGDVDVLLGGSPCQGFTNLTMDKKTRAQFKNRSLIASFASSVDFWRPRWGILENVLPIVKNSRRKRDREDYFSQIICALVGMGYQVEIVLGEAWSYGDPQQRQRALLCFAAPGVKLPKSPYPSHSTPDYVGRKGLGIMTNGEAYVKRVNHPTAFKFVSVSEATADLPDIYDARTETCIPFPDHRLAIPIASGSVKGGGDGASNHAKRSNRLSVPLPSGDVDGEQGGMDKDNKAIYANRKAKAKRTQLLNIPIAPYGVGFAQARYTEVGKERITDMFDHERDAFPSQHEMRGLKTSNAWGRVHPHKLFATITTTCSPTCAIAGGSMGHWEQPRHISIMEVRRAQGVPDDEVLLGNPREQWALVGNAVARGMSMAMGLCLREAWLGTLYEDGSPGQLPVGVMEKEETRLSIPWVAARDRDGGQDDNGDVSLVPNCDSRSITQTPALSEPEVGGPRFSSQTPATSVTETQADEPTPTNGKRPLFKRPAEAQVPNCSAFKRPRYVQKGPAISFEENEYGELVKMIPAIQTYEENEYGELMLLRGSGPMEGVAVSKEVDLPVRSNDVVPEEVDIPQRSASGMTVVRMSSEDFPDDI